MEIIGRDGGVRFSRNNGDIIDTRQNILREVVGNGYWLVWLERLDRVGT